jgi:hypothetical protein
MPGFGAGPGGCGYHIEMEVLTADLVLDRMVRAVQDVRDRLFRATSALEAHAVPYAVVGEQAAAFWVAQADEGGVRDTPAVDVLIRRADLPKAKAAFENAGFVARPDDQGIQFLDGPSANLRDAVRMAFAHESTRPSDLEPAPDIEPQVSAGRFRVLELEPLVRWFLAMNRRIDRVVIRDLLGVGQIDETWPDRFPPELADRLREILADPEG